MMKRRPLGSTGLEVSPIGFGGASLASGANVAASRAAVHMALDAGVNLIDTAACYGDSEGFLGRELRARRGEFILVSKCGHHDMLPDGQLRSRRISMGDVDLALKRLQTGVIDVMLLHSYDLDLLRNGEAIGVLAAARKAGKIRFIGYSGDNEAAAAAASMPEVSVLEISHSVCDQANRRTVLTLAGRRNLGVLAKRSVANAAWLHRSSSPGAFATLHARPYIERLQLMVPPAGDPGLGADTDEEWAELFLRFTLSIPEIHCAIVGTVNLENIRRNLAAAGKGPLPARSRELIERLYAEAEEKSGEKWTAQN